MNRIILILTVILSLSAFQGFSQFDFEFTTTEKQKSVVIHQDSIIDSLLVLHKKFNAIDHRVEGYRIQVFFESGNNSKTKAEEFKEKFNEEFPETKAYVSFKEPFYRVRVGDFKTKFSADRALNEIRKEYPNAWVIKDKINYPRVEVEIEEIPTDSVEYLR